MRRVSMMPCDASWRAPTPSSSPAGMMGIRPIRETASMSPIAAAARGLSSTLSTGRRTPQPPTTSNGSPARKHLLILWLFKHGNRISDPPRLEWDAPLNLRARSYLFVHRQGEQRVEGKATELEVFQTLANDPDKVGHVFPWRTRSGVYKWL